MKSEKLASHSKKNEIIDVMARKQLFQAQTVVRYGLCNQYHAGRTIEKGLEN